MEGLSQIHKTVVIVQLFCVCVAERIQSQLPRKVQTSGQNNLPLL